MPGLREALAELAEQARPYGDAQAAVRAAAAARRRRQILIPGAALVVVVTLVAVVAGTLARGGEPPQPAQPSAPAEHTFPYPKEPVTLDPAAPLLPVDAPVGAASFVWARGSTALHVVLPDGRQFQIPLDPVTGEADSRSAYLSPDGRVLIWRTANGARLRDLTSTRQAELEARAYSFWSPNSRWVVGWSPGGDAVRLDVETLDEVALPRLDNRFGVLDTGELLIVDSYPGGESVRFSVLDPVTGDKVRSFVVDAEPHLHGSESVYLSMNVSVPSAPRVVANLWTAGGGLGLLRIDEGDDPGAGFPGESATGLLVFSTTDGRVLRRIDRSVPEQQHTTGGFIGLDGALSWDPVDGNQLILLDNVDGVCTIALVDIASGERVEAARWDCGLGASIAVRGWVAHV